MKLKLFILVLIIVLLGGGGWVYWSQQQQAAQAAPTPVVTVAAQPDVVSAEAFVKPVQKADLSFEVGGRVTSVMVHEGDRVKQGQPLAELDNSSQQAKVAQAQASLGEAEAQLAKLAAGATPEEVAQAEAGLAKTQAILAELIVGPTPEQIAEAEARVNTARAQLAQVLAGSRDEEIQAAASRMLQAEAEVKQRQAEYDQNIFGDPQVAEPYGVALQKAKLNYDAVKAQYDRLVNGASNEDIAVAQAGVNIAQKGLERLKAGTTSEQIAGAQAEVARAQAALAQVEAGATVEQIAIAQAGVQTAQAGLQAAQVELAKTQALAPFDGTVGIVNIHPGEIVTPGSTALSIGDTSQWQVETDDLTEIDVVRVQEGQTVKISVDALPDVEFEGKVVRVTPKSETKAGDVTYTVLIDITKGDTSKLRWGMTTFVDIETGPEI